jgi:beta-xylosidase
MTAAGADNDRTFGNPILPGFHPDPSICRVGADYYLVTSTFEWFPGLPVHHSRDLVHWRLLGHVLDRPSQLPLDGVPPSGGLFAPTIRFWRGTFSVVCTLMHGTTAGGTFVVTATDPAGPWSEPAGGTDETLGETPVADGRVHLAAEAHGQAYSFRHAPEPGRWRAIGGTVDGRLLSPPVAGGFTGAYVGMYATGGGRHSENVADFAWFEYRALP